MIAAKHTDLALTKLIFEVGGKSLAEAKNKKEMTALEISYEEGCDSVY